MPKNRIERGTDNLEYVIKPSQWMNFPYYVILFPLVYIFWDYPIVWGFWLVLAIYRYLDVYFWRFEFREMTITERRGVLSVTKDTIQYYRIKSIRLDQPFWLRILGLSNVMVITSEQFKPALLLKAVYDGEPLRNLLNAKMFTWRKNMGTKDIDFFDSN